MSIILNGTTGITTPDITSSGSLNIDASAPDNSLVVNSSGNVGIGTSSPASALSFGGTKGLNSTAGVPTLRMYDDGTNSFGIAGSSSGGSALDISCNFGSGNIRLFTGGTTASPIERARIDSSGNLLVGTTSTIGSARFVVAADSGTTNPMAVHNTKSTASTDYSVLFYRNSALVGSIQTSLSATSFITSSDYRLKEDWVAVANASTRVNALKPINFAWKVDGSRVDGFLAHELADVVPEAVTGAKDATEMVDIKDEEGNVTGQEERPVYQGIDQSKLVPLLTAALQEALAAIETLTARVSALEAK